MITSKFLNKRIYLITVMALSQCSPAFTSMNTELDESNDLSKLPKMLTVSEIEERMNQNPFLLEKNNYDTISLTPGEKRSIENVAQDEVEKKCHVLEHNIKLDPTLSYLTDDVNYQFNMNRNIADFNGDTLVIGGTRIGTGVTSITELNADIANIRINKFDTDTGEKLNEQRRATLIAHTEDQIKNKFDEYYTLNYSNPSSPDLTASATDLRILEYLPENRFKTIYYENVDGWVFLNPKTLYIARQLCQPGGTIKIASGSNALRLLIIALQDMPHVEDYLKQLLMNYDECVQDGGCAIEFQNNK